MEPAATPEPFPTKVIPGVDTDSDGLTDTEEDLIYRTNSRLPDTDADGFLDGNEVFHGYNPSGTAPGTLLESGLVVTNRGTSELSMYEVNYPSVWSFEGGEDGLVFDASTGEGVRVSFAPKAESMSLASWVTANRNLEDTLEGTTKNGRAFVQTQSQLTVFVDIESAVMIFEYDPGAKARVDYLQTFQMMLNSVQVVGVVDVAAPEAVPGV